MTSTEIKKLAELYQCSHSTIRRWDEEGAPLGNDAKMRNWLEARKHSPTGTKKILGMEDGTPLSQARLRKLELETQTIQHKLDVERGKYVTKSKSYEDGIRIGAVLTAELAALLNDMPGALAGLGEIEIRRKLGERVERLKVDIKKELRKATA